MAGIGLFHRITEVDEVEVELADESIVRSKYKGRAFIDIGSMTVWLGTVSFILKLQLNLLSWSRLDNHGITTMSSERTCTFLDRHKTIAV